MTVCVPAARGVVRVAVLKEAVVTPPVVVTLTGLPALLPSIWNCTVPVGMPAPGAVMIVAVTVMLCLNGDGFAEVTTVVLLLAVVTVWVKAVEALALNFVSPL
jgi:hypothetical protein